MPGHKSPGNPSERHHRFRVLPERAGPASHHCCRDDVRTLHPHPRSRPFACSQPFQKAIPTPRLPERAGPSSHRCYRDDVQTLFHPHHPGANRSAPHSSLFNSQVTIPLIVRSGVRSYFARAPHPVQTSMQRSARRLPRATFSPHAGPYGALVSGRCSLCRFQAAALGCR